MSSSEAEGINALANEGGDSGVADAFFSGLENRIAELKELWGNAVARAGLPDDHGWDPEAVLRVLSDSDVLRLVDGAGRLSKVVDSLCVRLSGVVGDRSRRELGGDGLARQAGYRSGEQLLADVWGVFPGEARRFLGIAVGVKSRESITGEVLPPLHPVLAEAVTVGGVSVTQAGVILDGLGEVRGCSPGELEAAERILVRTAPDVSLRDLKRLVVEVRDRLDPDGVEPRGEEGFRRRSLTIVQYSDGMTHVDWVLPPEDAGIVLAGIDSYISKYLRGKHSKSNGSAGPAEAEGDGAVDPGLDPVLEYPETTAPSMAQLRSDAAVAMFQHAAGCTNTTTVGSPFTVTVRMSLDQLVNDINHSAAGVDGPGMAIIDGILESIPAGTARRMACSAGIIPMVLGGDSEVLDVGRVQRFFTKPMRTVLAERDHGCAWPGCTAPPSYCEAHHIKWWNRDYGETNTQNGILLCRRHHRLIHTSGWEIHTQTRDHYLVPPAHLDPTRTPRKMRPPPLAMRM